MTQISDERLNELIALNNHELERVGGVMRGHDAYKQEYLDTVKALEELLSLRSLNKRLVEYTGHWAGCLSEASNCDGDCTCGYTALMKEIGGG